MLLNTFLDAEHQQMVPLAPLPPPKCKAVENWLQQKSMIRVAGRSSLTRTDHSALYTQKKRAASTRDCCARTTTHCAFYIIPKAKSTALSFIYPIEKSNA